MKSSRLISLVGEILRQPNIDYIVGLLVISFIQVQNKKEQVRKNKMQKCTDWGEKEHRNLDVGACNKRQKRPDGKQNKGNGFPS